MAKERIRAGSMHNGFALHVDAIPGARSYKNVSSFAASRFPPLSYTESKTYDAGRRGVSRSE